MKTYVYPSCTQKLIELKYSTSFMGVEEIKKIQVDQHIFLLYSSPIHKQLKKNITPKQKQSSFLLITSPCVNRPVLYVTLSRENS